MINVLWCGWLLPLIIWYWSLLAKEKKQQSGNWPSNQNKTSWEQVWLKSTDK